MPEINREEWLESDCAGLANNAQIAIDVAERSIAECIGRVFLAGREGDPEAEAARQAFRLLNQAAKQLDVLIDVAPPIAAEPE